MANRFARITDIRNTYGEHPTRVWKCPARDCQFEHEYPVEPDPCPLHPAERMVEMTRADWLRGK
jgi:hypothetical protein